MLDDGELVVRHAAGLAEDARGRRLDPELAPHLVEAADTRQPVAIDDTRESALVDTESMERAGVRSVLAVPLLALGDVLGFLSFNWHTGPHVWSASEIEFASQLGVAAGLALETVRSREDLLASERRFRATFDQAGVGMAHVALDGTWLRVNDALCRITGYSREELMRLTFQQITHPDDLDTDLEQVAALVDGDLDSYTSRSATCGPTASPCGSVSPCRSFGTSRGPSTSSPSSRTSTRASTPRQASRRRSCSATP